VQLFRAFSIDNYPCCIILGRNFNAFLQVGGQQPRWQLYHHLYLIEHSGKRTTPLVKGPTGANPQKPAPPLPPRQDHPLNEHVGWMLPSLLRVCACLHAIWTPQVTFAGGKVCMSGALVGYALKPDDCVQ